MASEKGFSLIEVLIVILLFAMAAGGLYLWQNNRISPHPNTTITSPTPTVAPSPEMSPTPTKDVTHLNSQLSEALKTFPVYPGAKVNYKTAFTDNNVMSWTTTDDGDNVRNWYRADSTHTGWTCSVGASMGGYGGPRDIEEQSGCHYKDKSYRFILEANETTTEFALVVVVD